MTTHDTPLPKVMTRASWRAMIDANNDSAATDPVDWVETTAPHFQPRGRHRWLWHYAIPIGELVPGEQQITSRSGTAYSQAAAKRQIKAYVNRHFYELAGRDPHGPMLDRIRRYGLAMLLLTGFALFVQSAGCQPSVLGIIAMGAAVVGILATWLKSHRAGRAKARRL